MSSETYLFMMRVCPFNVPKDVPFLTFLPKDSLKKLMDVEQMCCPRVGGAGRPSLLGFSTAVAVVDLFCATKHTRRSLIRYNEGRDNRPLRTFPFPSRCSLKRASPSLPLTVCRPYITGSSDFCSCNDPPLPSPFPVYPLKA